MRRRTQQALHMKKWLSRAFPQRHNQPSVDSLLHDCCEGVAAPETVEVGALVDFDVLQNIIGQDHADAQSKALKKLLNFSWEKF